MTKFNIKRYSIVLLVVLLLFFLHYTKILNPLESILGRILTPAAKNFYSFSSSVGQIFRSQTDAKILEEQLKKAREEVGDLTVENAELKFLEEENSVLRKHLNFLKFESNHYLMANIISRGKPTDEANDSQSAVIDKGAREGLFPGLAVISSTSSGTSTQGVIIGKVINVKDNISEIYLVTNKDCKLAASILGENKTSGIAHGELGLTVRMDFIPQTENIKVGDIAATSGLEQNIKRGLVIGLITGVSKENNEVWQSATIEPLLNLDTLTIVSILLP